MLDLGSLRTWVSVQWIVSFYEKNSIEYISLEPVRIYGAISSTQALIVVYESRQRAQIEIQIRKEATFPTNRNQKFMPRIKFNHQKTQFSFWGLSLASENFRISYACQKPLFYRFMFVVYQASSESLGVRIGRCKLDQGELESWHKQAELHHP